MTRTSAYINDPEIQALREVLYRRLVSMPEAIRKAAMLASLKKAMQEGIAHFTFDKANGEERPAYGTRAPDIIKRHGGTPKGDERTYLEQALQPTTFIYFDLGKRAWRSFRPENLVEIDNDYCL
jgi:hypothetical protein